MVNSSDLVIVTRHDRVATVTLNRPDSLNVISPPLKAALDGALLSLRDDPGIWVVIITGAGDRAFSAGADLKWRASNERAIQETSIRGAARGWPILTDPSYNFFKPVIAAVNGYAVGGGLELALACDLVIASENARFGLPEPRRGLMADAGGVHRLSRQIPVKLAMELILTGRLVDAATAARIGLINAVVPASELVPGATALATEILECSPLAVQAAKQAIMLGRQMPERDAIAAQFSLFEALRRSPDFLEGPRAFAEKRRPKWTGLGGVTT